MLDNNYILINDNNNVNNKLKIRFINQLFIMTLLVTCFILLIKYIPDHTINGICETRNFLNETNLLYTWQSQVHAVQGFFFTSMFYGIIPLYPTYFCYDKMLLFMIFIWFLCGIGYHVYNFCKRFFFDYMIYSYFRDSSYFLNEFDWLFGSVVGFIPSIIIFVVFKCCHMNSPWELFFENYIREINVCNKKIKISKLMIRLLLLIIGILIGIFICDIVLFSISKHFENKSECENTHG